MIKLGKTLFMILYSDIYLNARLVLSYLQHSHSDQNVCSNVVKVKSN